MDNIFKSALLLNNIDRGTIQTALQTNNYYRTVKLLNTSVKNWESICRILEKDVENEILVIGKFTENSLFRMCLPMYESVVKRLLNLIAKKRHLIFIYKSNLFGKFNYLQITDDEGNATYTDENTGDVYYYNDDKLERWLNSNGVCEEEEEYTEKVNLLVKEIINSLNILSYEKLIDIEISGQSFIENIAEGLLFRIYIPSERIWSSEFDKFINLFRDYASNIANKELKITQNKTDSGTVCSLYSVNKDLAENEINDLYKEFTAFMDVCTSNIDEAESIISKLDINIPQKQHILKKYIRESQRILLDIKQERELKIIAIKHRLQNELQEFDLSDEINNYIERSISSSDFSNNFIYGIQKVENQTIIIQPNIIDKVESVIISELNGNIKLNAEELEISKLIEKYSSNILENSELQTSLHELNDNGSSNDQKRSASQKIYSFLSKVADKVGDVGVALLSKYLEQKIGI